MVVVTQYLSVTGSFCVCSQVLFIVVLCAVNVSNAVVDCDGCLCSWMYRTALDGLVCVRCRRRLHAGKRDSEVLVCVCVGAGAWVCAMLACGCVSIFPSQASIVSQCLNIESSRNYCRTNSSVTLVFWCQRRQWYSNGVIYSGDWGRPT